MTAAELEELIAEMLANAARLGKTVTRKDCLDLLYARHPDPA
jgi:hypothetical protein